MKNQLIEQRDYQYVRPSYDQFRFFSEEVGIEAEVVDREIQPSLTRKFSFPVTAGIICRRESMKIKSAAHLKR